MANATKKPPKTHQRSTKVDSASTRYTINQPLLFISLAVFAVTLTAGHFWYQYQLGKITDSFLVRAEQLEQQEDWSVATSYYQRYLRLYPEDTAALIKMVEAYAQGQPTPDRMARLTRLLYQVLGRAPERQDLRLMLAETLLQTGNFEAAEKEAEKLADNPSTEQLPAQKVLALARFAQSRDGGSEALAPTVEALCAVAEELPDDVQLVSITADALRQHPTGVQLPGQTTATAADEMMDRLVASDPNNAAARIARHRYRARYRLADPWTDLEAALELAPDNLEVLLLSSSRAAAQTGQEEHVTTLLERAVGVAPQDPRAYLALASISKQANDLPETLKWLRQGLSKTDNNLQLSMVLCGELIAQKKLEEAARILRSTELKSTETLARLTAAARAQVENQIRLLDARLALANKNPENAEAALQAILLATEATGSQRQSIEWIQGITMLARMTAAAGRWDEAANYWEKLAGVLPRNESICQSTAAAHLKAGNPASAVQRLRDYARLAKPTAEMLLQLTQAHLRMQLMRPAPERNWVEFLDALERAKTKNEDRWELVLAEVDYLLANSLSSNTPESTGNDDTATANRSRTAQILQAAESDFQTEANFWRGAARAYQLLGLEADAQRALDRYLEFESSAMGRAQTQVAFLTDSGEFEAAEQLLVALRSSLSTDERRQIDRLRIQTLISARKNSAALELASQLIAADPEDPKLLAMGIEIALGLGNFETAEQWETALGNYESSRNEWRYLLSLRQLLTYHKLDDLEKEELARTVAAIRVQRPQWYPGIALSGWHAQINRNLAQAEAEYRLAVDLGDRRARTIEQLVAILYQGDKLSEAEKYLALIGNGGTSQSISRDSLAIQLALKQDRIDEALELAEQGVERFPDEVMRHIWLANLTLRNQQPEEAIQILKRATQRFPEDPQAWKGLFSLFANSGQTEEARETLAALLALDALPLESRHFMVAQGYEILGDLDESLQHYQQAVALAPQQAAIRLRYAKRLLAEDTSRARDQYEKILSQSPENSEARRELAVLLAAEGQDKDWQRAQQLLAPRSNDSPADSAANDRLLATLLVRQGTPQQRLAGCRTAREILQQLIRTSGNQELDMNRRLLASVYEQEARLANDRSLLHGAREQLRYLVDREDPSPQNLTLYIEFLMRHAAAKSSPVSAIKSAAESTTESQLSSGDELRDVFLADAESRLRDLKKSLSGQDSTTPNAMAYVDLAVQLLQVQGEADKASEYVAEWVNSRALEDEDQDKTPQAQLCLMTGRLYSRLGQHTEAERWYRQLMEIMPQAYLMVVQSLVAQDKQQEAAELCLEVAEGEPDPEEAIVLTRIMTSAAQSEKTLPDVQKVIEQVVAKHGDHLSLLQAEAVMHASQGEYDQAIASFRRLIEANEKDVLAMNNLATLLAERSNQRAEALEHINRAIDIAGRLPALLDTQGTIFLKMDDSSQAILCLEEAVAAGATDPRYYFHLAAAYELAERLDEAAISLETARDYGLENSVLTADDRSLLARLDEKLSAKLLLSTGAN